MVIIFRELHQFENNYLLKIEYFLVDVTCYLFPIIHGYKNFLRMVSGHCHIYWKLFAFIETVSCLFKALALHLSIIMLPAHLSTSGSYNKLQHRFMRVAENVAVYYIIFFCFGMFIY